MVDRDSMSESAKAALREYKRNWNRRNKDKVMAAQNRYWEKKARMMGGEAENEHAETDEQHKGESSVPDDRAGV